MAFLYRNVWNTPRENINKIIPSHSAWFSQTGFKKIIYRGKTKNVDARSVFRMAFEAVAPI